jgi:hypothetical protein
MSIELTYQALYEALSLSDSSPQIWISVTFAVIVAAHLAGNRIRRATYGLVSGLYGLYSLVLVVRYCSAAYQIFFYQNQLIEHGLDPWPVPKAIGMLIGVGTIALMVGGTIATLWFVRSVKKENETGGQ